MSKNIDEFNLVEQVKICLNHVYNKNDYDEDGYDEDGYDKDGYDEYGYDKDGYDKDGCDIYCYDRQGRDTIDPDYCSQNPQLEVIGNSEIV